MNYLGDYQNNTIYGTSDNRRIKIETVDEANFIHCEVTVDFNGLQWVHNFEVPFFNNNAEFYFENYIHSIIIQNLSDTTVSSDQLSITSFDIASVSLVLKEMKQSEELDELQYDFYMSLGSFDPISYTNIQNGSKLLLPTTNSKYITQKGILSFSFFSLSQPDKLLVDVDNNVQEINGPTNNSGLLLHTIFVPVKSIIGINDVAFSLSLRFANNSVFSLGDFVISNRGLDHSHIVYQNQFGTLTSAEFTGLVAFTEEYKIGNIVNTKGGFTSSKTNSIETNSLKTLNTGFILDNAKYNMIEELIRSYNIHFLDGSELKKVILKGKPKIRPYITDKHLRHETLTFKVSENDHILYRGF
jgi:hypothetical protein